MMNYTGWEIPEGKVIKVEDADGRVIWMLPSSGKPVILQVEKITSDTYAGETTYTGEQFILLDIYPKTNGTVKVTYGGLTKTIKDTSGAEEPNAQQVFFGTFNGVADSVETPASGELTIEGSYRAFGIGSFQKGSKSTNVGYCSCITAVADMGEVESVPAYAFYKELGTYSYPSSPDDSNFVDEIILPATLTSIGKLAMAIEWVENYAGQTATIYQCIARKIIVLAETPPTIAPNDRPFGGSTHNSEFTIIVPKGCRDTFKAAEGWSYYATATNNRIVEAE